jgi:ABC-type branched-subunit amino acid transport system substrate-binding protein
MTRTDRRTLLKSGAALAGAAAIGFPSIVSGQTEKIKIGHLTPLTGFLGALGGYAQLGIRMAEAEINQAGSSTSPRKIPSIPPPPPPRPSACWSRTASRS